MSGYLIHYGVRGMKWKKGKKSAKPDSIIDKQRKRKMNRYSYTSSYTNRLSNKKLNSKTKTIKINGKKVEDWGEGFSYKGRMNPKLEKKIKKILNKRYNKKQAKKGKKLLFHYFRSEKIFDEKRSEHDIWKD